MMKQDEIGKHGKDQQALLKRPSWRLEPANSADFDLVADIRQQAMKDNMEANGLFDHALYRQSFKDSFDPASTWKIIEESEVLGFYVLWNKQDHLYLERLYFHPKAQGRGIGADILNILKQQATAQNKPIRLEVLPQSRANAFYLRHGFELIEEREEEKVYEWKSCVIAQLMESWAPAQIP
ncbi:GNAT family N-acetyltransferase [Pseudovibrio sp. WM33]|uniref:GNAT family N-acetyltransferase n=1 Tax=Pseudovibrio sp. WM33 TaxID=1735585 RepID=UPI0007AEBF67|nr:GNAT family N-acetyltransferase [Pseudovibrio sp. WM33]KZL19734.1 putative acetyltransferase [Pseudovibrio sp. WM33]